MRRRRWRRAAAKSASGSGTRCCEGIGGVTTAMDDAIMRSTILFVKRAAENARVADGQE
jgi:hypothetical protein